MHLGLERFKRYLFAINRDEGVLCIFGTDAERRDFVILDKRVVEKGIVADRKQKLGDLRDGDVAFYGDEIEEAVVDEGGVEEDYVGGHVGDLFWFWEGG